MKMKKAKSTAAILAVMALTAGFTGVQAKNDAVLTLTNVTPVDATTYVANADGSEIAGALKGEDVSLGNVTANSVQVNGNAFVDNGSSRLYVTDGNIQLNTGANSLYVSDNGTTVEGNLTVNQNADVKGDVTVEGVTNVGKTNVSGDLSVSQGQNNLYVTDNGVQLNSGANSLYVSDNGTTVEGNLTVNQNADVKGDVTVEGVTNVGKTNVSGDLSVSQGQNNLYVTDNGVQLNSGANSLYVSDNGTTVEGNLTVNQNADVKGDVTVEGVTNVGKTNVSGDLSVSQGQNNLYVTDNGVQLNSGANSLYVSDNGTTVEGNATVNNDLHVIGNTTIDGDLNTNVINTATGESLNINAGHTYVNGDETVTGKLTVNSGAILNGGATVNGGLTADTVTADTVTATNGNFDFVQGTDAKFTGTVSSGSLSVSGDAVVGGNLAVGGGLEVGGTVVSSDDLKAAGTAGKVIGTAPISVTDSQGNVKNTLTEAVNTNNAMIHENAVAIQNNSNAISSLDNRVSDLDSEIDNVGAISAALAGLHPLDYDGTGSKFQLSAAMGTYDGSQAAAIGAFYHFNRDVMISLGGATAFDGDHKTAGNLGVTFRVGAGASGKAVSDDVMARLEAMDRKITALEQENKDLKNVLGAIDTSLSKEFPDVPANHWAYEAVSKLAGNDIVAGYPDGEFHGDRTMTRYEMAEIIYKAMNKGVQVDQKLVNEFKPEMEQVAANQNA